uniref:Uncharacterized protein n=1 Tax=Amphimedon queenslandica TaxID=400682 RepID=A0A1X7TG82_AMPQE
MNIVLMVVGMKLVAAMPQDIKDIVTCHCNHLTHFAILLSPGAGTVDLQYADILTVIGYVLVPISLEALQFEELHTRNAVYQLVFITINGVLSDNVVLCIKGIPAVYMMTVVPIGYVVDTGNDQPNHYFCWLSYETGFIWKFIAPVILIILVNLKL